MMDPRKLESWLPVLQHPEHGKAICEAAGVQSMFINGHDDTEVWLNNEGWGGCSNEILDTAAVAALAFGVLAVMSRYYDNPHFERVLKELENNVLTADFAIAAAHRWLGIEVSA